MATSGPTVLLAPDSFRGSLDAPAVAEALAAGLREARPDVSGVARPVADGGEGTVAVLVAAGWHEHGSRVTGPTGRAVDARWARSPDTGTAVVELATASGLALLAEHERNPLHAGSAGTGELVRAALDAGVGRLVLAVGGSATTDAGAGMLAVLGVRLLDADGEPLPPGGAALRRLAGVDVSGLDPRLGDTEVVVACDVDNPLTGPTGAATVYAPQKGASAADVAELEEGLRTFARVVARDTGVDVDVPGAGAAGGVAAAALGFLGARLTPGIDLVLDLVGFDACLAGADLVVTGEGSFDSQSLHGKAPVGVAARSRAVGVPVVVVAGRVALDVTDRARLPGLGITGTYALLDLEPDPVRAQRDAGRLLHRAGATWLPAHLPAPTEGRSTEDRRAPAERSTR